MTKIKTVWFLCPFKLLFNNHTISAIPQIFIYLLRLRKFLIKALKNFFNTKIFIKKCIKVIISFFSDGIKMSIQVFSHQYFFHFGYLQ